MPEARRPNICFPAPAIRVYPRETVVAGKVEALVQLGVTNSRMKDFYDLWLLARLFAFGGETIAAALASTFARRATPPPETEPIALTDVFTQDAGKAAEWRAFIRRAGIEERALTLPAVIEALRAFLLTPLAAVRVGPPYPAEHWEPGGPWAP